MLLSGHEVFQPIDDGVSLWRYMDFTKLLSLLEDEVLILPRADAFEDPYEGLYSSKSVEYAKTNQVFGPLTDDNMNSLVAHAYQMRKQVFVSCWYSNEHESAAMWKLFLQSNEGVAIRTTCGRLKSIFTKSPFMAGISNVKYIDYEVTPIVFGNSLFPFIHKRMSFAHENEVRAVVWAPPSNDELPKVPSDARAIGIDAHFEDLVTSVYVSPTAPEWFADLVKKVITRYGFPDIPVIQSKLYEAPILNIFIPSDMSKSSSGVVQKSAPD